MDKETLVGGEGCRDYVCLFLWVSEGIPTSRLISEDFVCLWESVCLSSLMFYLPVPVEGLGQSSFPWVCLSGQSETSSESSWFPSGACPCPHVGGRGVLSVFLRIDMSVPSEGSSVSL